jgi:MarR family transcriptional regulator, organic hydroperoxide resistance regulator
VATQTTPTKAPAPPSVSAPGGLASEAWVLLQRVAFSQRPAFVAAARELDLIPPHVFALQSLERPMPMGELARTLACDNSNVTGIVDRLEERGLVERTAAEHDRRVKVIVLTPEGRRVRERLEARMAEPPQPILALSRADQRALRDVLRLAVAELESSRAQSSNSA